MNRPLLRISALLVGATVFTAGSAVATAAPTRQAPARQTSVSTANMIHGHVKGTSANGATLVGRFTPTKFVRRGSVVRSVGNLTATLTKANGRTFLVDQTIRMRVAKADFDGTKTARTAQRSASAVGSCQILNLVLGPLDLNLLGLVVHLNRVHLNITAQTGPGNLLGNLLCAVAHLLDGVSLNALLGRLAGLLNQILADLNP